VVKGVKPQKVEEKKEEKINEVSELLIEPPVKSTKKSFCEKVKEALNPPIYAAIIATPLALIPYMKKFVLSQPGAVFQANLFTAGQMMGSCVSPLICVLLGSKLSHGYPKDASISK
jgi:predicted permease